MQSYSGNILLEGYSSNALVVLSSQLSSSDLGNLAAYPIANNNIVVSRSSSVSGASVSLSINYVSPTRVISGSTIVL